MKLYIGLMLSKTPWFDCNDQGMQCMYIVIYIFFFSLHNLLILSQHKHLIKIVARKTLLCLWGNTNYYLFIYFCLRVSPLAASTQLKIKLWSVSKYFLPEAKKNGISTSFEGWFEPTWDVTLDSSSSLKTRYSGL